MSGPRAANPPRGSVYDACVNRSLVVLLAASCAAALGCRQVGNWTGRSEKVARVEAERWARNVGVEPTGVSCSGYDSDGDGYVSCSVGYKIADGSLRTIPLECARAFTLNEGCREVRVNPLRP